MKSIPSVLSALVFTLCCIAFTSSAFASGYSLFSNAKTMKAEMMKVCQLNGYSERECAADNRRVNLHITSNPENGDPLAFSCSRTKCYCDSNSFLGLDCFAMEISVCDGEPTPVPDSGGVKVCDAK